MEACNKNANEQVSSKAENVLKNAALGAAISAAVARRAEPSPQVKRRKGAIETLRVLRAERFAFQRR
jgi:hypothetical protein